MPRFFAPAQQLREDTITLTGENAAHAKVLRLHAGDEVTVCDGEGTDYSCVIEAAEADGLRCRIEKREASAAEPCLRIALFQGMPKAEKLEWIIQKNTELGVDRVIPVETRRSVVHLEEKKRKGKEERWRKIAAAAAKQSGRGILPRVESPVELETLDFSDFDLVLLAYEGEHIRTLKQALTPAPGSRIALLIGPEGGFEPREVQHLEEKGALPVTLGPRILRTETAGMAMLAQLLFALEG